MFIRMNNYQNFDTVPVIRVRNRTRAKKVLKSVDHMIGRQIEAGQAQQVSCGAHQLKNKISKCEKIIKIGKYSKLKKE